MDKARLIAGAFLWTGLVAATTLDPRPAEDGADPDESEQWQRFSRRCASDSLRTLSRAEADFAADDRDGDQEDDFRTIPVAGLPAPDKKGPDPCDAAGGETCAAAILAREEKGWSPKVAGTYAVTSTALLMPGTDHAVRVIEFSPPSADEDEEGFTP